VAADFYHRPLLRVFPVQLRHLLTKAVPIHVAVEASDADQVFDLLVRAFNFAARRYPGDPAITNCLRLLTPNARIKLAVTLADESKFSQTKQLTMRAAELGVDPRSPEGIDRLVESLEARPLASAKPTKGVKVAKVAKPTKAAKPPKAAQPTKAAKPPRPQNRRRPPS
jgi:hypothetical protein